MGEELKFKAILDSTVTETVTIRLSEYKALLQKATTLDIIRLSIMDKLRNTTNVFSAVNDDLVMLLTDTLDAYREALAKQEAKE